jgi:preprotein translocase YajC subunit
MDLNQLLLPLLSIALLGGMYYFLIRAPQKKQAKKAQETATKVIPGAVVVTYGGIVGLVKEVNEDNIKINSAGSSFTIKKDAIYQVEKEAK